MLQPRTFISIPGPRPVEYDHGAYDARTGRVFVAGTGAGTVEVIDADKCIHERTLAGHPEAAGIVVADGCVAVTNRGARSVTLLDAVTLECLCDFTTGERPNGVALAPRQGVVIVACIGGGGSPQQLECIGLRSGRRDTLALPGRPRWCMVDPAEERVFCAIREPSMVLVVALHPFTEHTRWPLPSEGAHGLDLDSAAGVLYVACDAGSLLAVRADDGAIVGQWPLPGAPDATFFNPATGRVHVAVADPGVIVSVEPRTGAQATLPTEAGAKTTALAAPDRLFVFMPKRGGALELIEQPA